MSRSVSWQPLRAMRSEGGGWKKTCSRTRLAETVKLEEWQLKQRHHSPLSESLVGAGLFLTIGLVTMLPNALQESEY
jgi:hypothetical protein